MGGRSGATVLAGLGVGILAWASLVERNRFTLREYALPVLPAGSPSVRVLHLSDLHMAPWQRRKQEWIASLATLKPDLLIGTGDFLGHERGIEGVRVALAPFAGTPGAFVNGSNDYFAPELKNPLKYLFGPSAEPRQAKRLNTAELRALYRELGWLDLNNAAETMRLGNITLELFGVDDAHRNFDRLDDVAELVLDAPTDAVRIGVTHAPYRRVLDRFVESGAGLIFAGHTHGGQVCLPRIGDWGGALVSNCDLPARQASGVSVWRAGLRRAFLEVSAGVGTSIFAPVRLFCAPEASLVTLVARD